jgi:hypothetical protein
MIRTLVNFAAFQLGWFACVLGAASAAAWVGLLAAGLGIALHLALAERPGQESRLIVLAVLMGLVVDSLLVNSGWLRYASPGPLPGLAPYWILAMWALFATTLNTSMSWLKGRPWLAVLLGAVFGPLSYLAGQRLGALEFVDCRPGMLALVFAWALAMPLLMLAAARFDGFRKPLAALPVQGLREAEG